MAVICSLFHYVVGLGFSTSEIFQGNEKVVTSILKDMIGSEN